MNSNLQEQNSLNPNEKVEKREKLQVKDLIFIGVFNAIIFVMMMAIAMVAASIPGLVLFSNSVVAILIAPIVLLMVAKVPKTGVFAISGVVVGLLYLLLGNPSVFVCLTVGGIIGEIILSINRYKNRRAVTASYVVLMVANLFGIFGLAYFIPQLYIDMYSKQGYPPEYFEQIISKLTTSMALLMLVAVIVAAIIGDFIGSKMLKKHFKKAGII